MSETGPELSDRMSSFAQALGDALSERLGSGVRIALAGLETIESDGGASDAVVDARWQTRGTPGDAIHLMLPAADATALAGLLLGRDKAEIQAKHADGPDAESIEALGELVQLALRELARALEGGAGGEALVHEDDPAEIRAPLAHEEWLDPGRHVQARFTLGLDGFRDGRMELVIPVGAVERWSGRGWTGAAAAGARPIALVDADPDAPAHAQALGQGLGRAVVHVDPAALARGDAEAVQAVAAASALVVAWDLAGRSGLELVEHLGRDARSRHAVVALASETPTRAMVEAALRAGAASFVLKPYDADELSRRLLTPPVSPDP